MKTTRVNSIFLSYREGTSDKVYHIFINRIDSSLSYEVECEWGRRTSSLRRQIKLHSADYGVCASATNKIMDQKLAKGYEVYAMDVLPESDVQDDKVVEVVEPVVGNVELKASDDERAKALERLRRAS